jgi:hypothetical protein
MCAPALAAGDAVATRGTTTTTSAEAQLSIRCSEDLREVQVNEEVVFNIPLTNNGETEVEVEAVIVKGCGCNGGKVTPKILRPHQEGIIEYKPDTAGFRSGPKHVAFLVKTGGGGLVNVKGEFGYVVSRDISFDPSGVDLGELSVGQEVERTVTIEMYSEDAEPKVTILPGSGWNVAVSKSELVKADRGEANARDVRKVALRIKGKAPDEAGPVVDRIGITIGDVHGQTRKFSIAVRGRVRPPIELSPSHLFLGVVKPGQAVERVVDVQGSQGAEAVMESLSSPEWVTVEPGDAVLKGDRTRMRLVLKINEAPAKSGTFNVEMTFASRQKRVKVVLPCIFVLAKEGG